MKDLLHIEQLKTHFSTEAGTVRAVDGVSLHVRAGETVCIVGESGCGKSITAMSVMGLVEGPSGKVVGGAIEFDGRDLLAMKANELRTVRGNDIAMIFQEPMSSLNPVLKIGEQIVEPLMEHRKLSRKEARARAIDLITLVGISRLEQIMDSYPHELSGGMLQRVMIAIAVSCNPKLLIADEPTTALDVTIQAQILDLLRSLKDEGGMSILLITHDLGVVAEMADIERVFDTNVYGVMNTIRAALPLLRHSGQGYIMTTSSVGGLVGQPFNEIYCASKFAVEGLMESLATYYKPAFNIDITLLEPGAIATEFTGTVMNHLQQTGGILEDEYKPILTRYMDNFAARTSVPQTSESVAEVVWSLVQAADKPLRIRTSEAAEAFARFKTEQDPTGLIGLKNTRRLHLNIDEEQ